MTVSSTITERPARKIVAKLNKECTAVDVARVVLLAREIHGDDVTVLVVPHWLELTVIDAPKA